MNDKPSRPFGSADENLVNDPEFPWGGACPYDILNNRLKAQKQPTLGPGSSAADVNKAGFALQAARPSPAERKTWDQLRLPRARLAIDFFHYPMPSLQIEDIDPAALERPMPVATPDLLAIADCKIELAGLPEPPAQVAAYQVPLSGIAKFEIADLLPAPLCTERPRLADMIEGDDDEQ